MEFTAVDIVILVILLVTAVRCAFRGFVAEIMAFAAVLLGLIAAVLFGGMVTPVLESYLGETVWTPVASFLGIFLLAYIVVKLFEGALYRLIEKIRLEKMDQALGFFLGLVEGVLIIVLLIFLVRIQPIFDPEPLFRGSFFVPLLEKLIPVGSGIIEGALQNSRV
jgi:membrane protein required for colicin V production